MIGNEQSKKLLIVDDDLMVRIIYSCNELVRKLSVIAGRQAKY